jgi:hypothetical protein
MKEYQQRHTLKKLLYSRISILVLGVICLLMMRSVIDLYGKYKNVATLGEQADRERKTFEDKLVKARERNEVFKTERGQEQYIRETYPMVKEGEGVIVVYEASTSPVVPVRKDVSFLERVKLITAAFFGR